MMKDNAFRRWQARLTMLVVDESGMSTVEYSAVSDYILCAGELQRRRAEGELTIKKLMIAVLAVALAKRGP